METVDSLNAINAKMDRIIELLEKSLELKSPPPSKIKSPKEITKNEWFVKQVSSQIVIKFAYNEEFKMFIKQLGGSWNISKKGWVFPESSKDHVVTQIQTKFPEWTLHSGLPDEFPI